MPRPIAKLSALAVKHAVLPGSYSDGGGLYLHISKSGVKSWIYRFMLNRKVREMGLGPCSTVSLAEARDRAFACRKLRNDGIDPLEARRRERARAELDAGRTLTFSEATKAYIMSREADWDSAKHVQRWSSPLATYVEPMIGSVRVQDVDAAMVLRVLRPIWTSKTVTASRVRSRIETILDWANVRGLRTSDNPARWRGHLNQLLPSPSKVRPVQHLAGLSFTQIPDFFAALRRRPAVAARALEFTILTATRSGQVRGASWNEVDLNTRVWTVPSDRMRNGCEHRVPLSGPAMAILHRMHDLRENDYVFPGDRRPTLSNMSTLMLLRRMGHSKITTHGFRSSFRDWCHETASFPSAIADAALGCAIADKAQAHQTGNLFERRRELMDAWGRYCETQLTEGDADRLALEAPPV